LDNVCDRSNILSDWRFEVEHGVESLKVGLNE
jgi:hypothetical protein